MESHSNRSWKCNGFVDATVNGGRSQGGRHAGARLHIVLALHAVDDDLEVELADFSCWCER